MEVKSLQPIDDGVLVELFEESTTTPSGLALVAAEKLPYVRGTVVAVGPGTLDNNGNLVPVSLSVGDKIIFEHPARERDFITVDGKKCVMTGPFEIFGIYE